MRSLPRLFRKDQLMAIVIIALIVLVPLALLGWDLARTKSHRHAPTAGGPSDHARPNAS